MLKNIFTLAMIQSLVMADASMNSDLSTSFLPGEPIQGSQVPAGLAVPSFIKVKSGIDMYFHGNFLYWKASTIDNQVGIKNNATKSHSSTLYFSTDYRPGFRVGTGISTENIVFDLVWTRYYQDFTSHFAAKGTDTVSPSSAGAGVSFVTLPDFKHLKSHWALNYDDILLTGQKAIFARPNFILDIAYGLDFMVQKQATRIQATTPGTLNTGLVQSLHKFWAIGPFLGMRLRAALPQGFRLLGKVDFNLDYQRFYKGDFILSFPTFFNPIANSRQSYAHSVTNYLTKAETNLGLDWSTYFAQNKLHLVLSATYDFITVFSFGPSLYEAIILGNTYFHGVTLGGRFDF